MRSKPLPLEVPTSPLLRRAVAEDRFDVTDYLRDGSYDGFRAEKDEVELRIAELDAALRGGYRNAGEVDFYLEHMFPPDALAAASESGGLDRLRAFAALQKQLDDALYELEDRALEPPMATDPTFAARPDLFDALDPRDRLLPLTRNLVEDERLGDDALAAWDGEALYPHPHLAPMRELVWELRDLAADGELHVSIAVHPYRITRVEDIQHRLLLDYWSGIQLTRENLDSLDGHDVDVSTFHGATSRSPAREFFRPLLGTWFDWIARKDGPDDPVKRLYVREVRPTTDRHGEPLVAALNRELHAERDTHARRFVHVDGKLRRYPAETYGPSPIAPRADFGPHSC